MWIPVVIGAVVVLAGGYIASRGRYYARMFSPENFRIFHEALSRAIAAAQRRAAGAEPSIEDETAFMTQAGLAVAVSWNDAGRLLHISFSQPGGPTTHAVCSHFGFFTLAMLASNKAELDAFFTESGVHHLVFQLESPDIAVRDLAAADAIYRREYRPVRFQPRSVPPA